MYRFNKFAVVLLILTGCNSQTDPTASGNSTVTKFKDAPSEAPYIQGIVTIVKEKQILVEENAAQVSGSAKARLQLTDSTRILHRSGETAGPSDLRVGQRVHARVTGPVMESYPVQGVADVIVIEP